MGDTIVLVTGAASGIGRAAADLLGRQGRMVIAADRDDAEPVARAIREAGGRALARRLDVGEEAEVDALVAEIERDQGGLDQLICAAGVAARTPVEFMTGAEWDDLMAVNLKGVFLCCRAALAPLRRRGGGAIVTLASDLALVTTDHLAAYGASKAGVVQFTRGLARDHAQDGIRVNVICPGPTETAMLLDGLGRRDDPAAARAAMEAAIPLGRLGRPEEIAAVIAFVASEAASFMTGSVVTVDGGVTI